MFYEGIPNIQQSSWLFVAYFYTENGIYKKEVTIISQLFLFNAKMFVSSSSTWISVLFQKLGYPYHLAFYLCEKCAFDMNLRGRIISCG